MLTFFKMRTNGGREKTSLTLQGSECMDLIYQNIHYFQFYDIITK